MIWATSLVKTYRRNALDSHLAGTSSPRKLPDADTPKHRTADGGRQKNRPPTVAGADEHCRQPYRWPVLFQAVRRRFGCAGRAAVRAQVRDHSDSGWIKTIPGMGWAVPLPDLRPRGSGVQLPDGSFLICRNREPEHFRPGGLVDPDTCAPFPVHAAQMSIDSTSNLRTTTSGSGISAPRTVFGGTPG
jgi:hypothetical protein